MGEKSVVSKRACHEGIISPTHRQAATANSQLETDYAGPMSLGECARTQIPAGSSTSTENGSRRATPISRTRSFHARTAFKASSIRSN